MRCAGAVETDQTFLGNSAVLFAGDVSDALMPEGCELIDQLLDTFNVIGEHRCPVIENVVHCDERQIAVGQLHDFGVIELDAGGDHTVDTAVAAMLEITGMAVADVVVDKGDIVAPALGVALEAVQHGGEELVRQAALGFVHEEDTQVVGAVGFQRPGCGVWHVAHLACRLAYLLFGGLADIVVAVQCLTHGSH